MEPARQTRRTPPPMLWTGLAGNGALNHRHAEVEAELEEQLEEDVLLRAVGLEVNNGGFESLGKLLAVRPPRPDVAAGQLEDAEAEVACEQRLLFPHLLPNAAQAFFGQLGDGAGLAEFVAVARPPFSGPYCLDRAAQEVGQGRSVGCRRSATFSAMTACPVVPDPAKKSKTTSPGSRCNRYSSLNEERGLGKIRDRRAEQFLNGLGDRSRC